MRPRPLSRGSAARACYQVRLPSSQMKITPMPTFSIVSTTVAQGSETAEVDTSEADFRSPDEAAGYARRMAEELFELSEQLALDFEYTQVAVYEGETEAQELDIDDPALVGIWMFVDDGIAWSDAQALRDEAAAEAPPALSAG